MSTDRINWLNSVLMVAACVAALAAPFHTFLFAYAVLGPLHYLTEVSWLSDRGFFVTRPGRRRSWLILVAVTIAVMSYGYANAEFWHRSLNPAFEIGLFYLVFLSGAVVAFVRHVVNVAALSFLALVLIFAFSSFTAYGVAATLLITIIHVFVFTAVFLVTGALKTGRQSGMISVLVFAACAASAAFLHIHGAKAVGDLRSVYAVFAQLNEVILRLLGRAPSEVFAQGVALGVMQFIAFAYTYHYLNWFSKTSIIGWHEISRVRAASILVVWALGVGLYVISYRIGFAVFFAMSAVHVMLEFPLNHQSFVMLARSIRMPRSAKAQFAG